MVYVFCCTFVVLKWLTKPNFRKLLSPFYLVSKLLYAINVVGFMT